MKLCTLCPTFRHFSHSLVPGNHHSTVFMTSTCLDSSHMWNYAVSALLEPILLTCHMPFPRWLRTTIQNLTRHLCLEPPRCAQPAALPWGAAPECCVLPLGDFLHLLSCCQSPLLGWSGFGNLSHPIHSSQAQTASNLIATITKKNWKLPIRSYQTGDCIL